MHFEQDIVFILIGLRSFWTVPGAVHGGQQLVVAQGLEVGHVVRGGVAEVQCQQERGAGGPHLGSQYYGLFLVPQKVPSEGS